MQSRERAASCFTLGLSPSPSLPALQVLLISARGAHSSLQLEHERMLVSQQQNEETDKRRVGLGWSRTTLKVTYYDQSRLRWNNLFSRNNQDHHHHVTSFGTNLQ